MSDFKDSLPQLLKYSWKTTLSYCPSLKASLLGEKPALSDHTSLLRQTKPNNFLISSSSCQPKGHASSRIPCGAHSTSPSTPSCFFPFLPQLLIAKAPIEKHLHADLHLRPTSQRTPLQQLTRHSSCPPVLIVTCLVVFSSSKGCICGTLLPLGPIPQNPWPGVSKILTQQVSP